MLEIFKFNKCTLFYTAVYSAYDHKKNRLFVQIYNGSNCKKGLCNFDEFMRCLYLGNNTISVKYFKKYL